jgi:hypothetical protein
MAWRSAKTTMVLQLLPRCVRTFSVGASAQGIDQILMDHEAKQTRCNLKVTPSTRPELPGLEKQPTSLGIPAYVLTDLEMFSASGHPDS